jgi:signal transduction histidine kinase
MVETVTSRFHRLSSPAQDALFAGVLSIPAFASLVAGPTFGPGPGPEPASMQPTIVRYPRPPARAFALVAAAFLPLALRRRFPLSVLAFVSIASAVYELSNNPPSIVFVAPLVALYTVGTLRDRRVLAIAGALSALVATSVTLPGIAGANFWPNIVRILSTYGVAAALGDATRNRRAYVAEVERRAADAELNREEEARRRVDEERLRIARELHDVTAHSLSIVAVQSGAALHVLDTDPAAARKALEAIRRTSKDALDELRAMLGVLRRPGDPDAPLAPVPGLSRIADLVVPLTDAGYDVRVDVPEDLDDLPAVVDFSAYRIVQEALTNVVRHAGMCRVDLSVDRGPEELLVRVEDDGRSPSDTDLATGHGLTGMRERVIALGGSFQAGVREGGGFTVAAHLPLGTRADA